MVPTSRGRRSVATSASLAHDSDPMVCRPARGSEAFSTNDFLTDLPNHRKHSVCHVHPFCHSALCETTCIARFSFWFFDMSRHGLSTFRVLSFIQVACMVILGCIERVVSIHSHCWLGAGSKRRSRAGGGGGGGGHNGDYMAAFRIHGP